MLLVPHSVARSNILKRSKIVAFQAMSLKKQDTFLPTPPHSFVLLPTLDSIKYGNSAHWSAGSRNPRRSTIGIAAVQTAIEYEYHFAEHRFAE